MEERGPGRVVHLVSSGGVVYRRRNGQIEVVICGRYGPERWSLPKGTPNEGESLVETALREVREETGLEPALQEPLGSIGYWFVRPEDRARCSKTVHFFLMTCEGGSVDRHDPEFDVVQWVSAEEAMRRLTFANEANVLQRALAKLADGAERPT